jgi:hypothetical protein
VVDEHLVVDETLVHHGVYRFGENIWLTEKEAYELMRKDRPAKTRRNAWSCSPPSVMPVEDYQAAIRAAREKGISIQEFLFWKEVACEAEAEERYKLGKNVSPLQNVTASPSDNAILGTTIKITARVKRSIQQDREYLPGETIELIGKQQAWRLIDTGAIGPPWIDSAGASAAPPAR